MASGSSGEPSPMIGEAGDGPSWFEQVSREETEKGACKRKRTDPEQWTPGCPFSLGSESDQKESMGAIYEHMASQELPQRNLASWVISVYYPEFTLLAVKMVERQVLCMIAEYHLACATKGSMTTSPILPEAVKPYLHLLVDYARPAGIGITDVRVCDQKAKSVWVVVWLHCMDMSLSWEKEALETLVQSRHSRAPLLSYFLAPRTSNLHYEEVVSRVLQENWEKHEEAKEKFRSSLNRSCCWWTRITQELDELSQGMEAAADGKVQKDIEERMNVLRTSLKKVEAAVAVNKNHL